MKINENRCVMCGEIIPEGTMVCLTCENRCSQKKTKNTIKITVRMHTIRDVKTFCELCSACSGEVLVRNGQYVVSGKSIMGLFSLDLTMPLSVEFYGEIPFAVKEGMKNFMTD